MSIILFLVLGQIGNIYAGGDTFISISPVITDGIGPKRAIFLSSLTEVCPLCHSFDDYESNDDNEISHNVGRCDLPCPSSDLKKNIFIGIDAAGEEFSVCCCGECAK